MKMTGAGAGELWYEEWLGLQFRMVLKDNLKKLLHYYMGVDKR